jgi:hypothetical protein
MHPCGAQSPGYDHQTNKPFRDGVVHEGPQATGTVRNYLSAVIAKTGTRNRMEALRAAEDAGWL